MKNSYFENLLFATATIIFGIMAGFFWTYTINVNRAMLEVDATTYATVQSLFNVNVRHPMFFVFFFGGGFFPILALVGNLKHWKTAPFICMVLAALIYVFGVIVFTQQVNLPLNYYTESWNPTAVPADWSAIRDQWNSANAIRVWTAGIAFLLSIVALVLRASQPRQPSKIAY